MSVSSPVLLALDTATDQIHAALVTPEATRVRQLPGGAQASTALLPALQALLAEARRPWRDVQAIAFGAGPGAFTGLRTACSVTQGLALGLGCPVIVLDTLKAVAEDARLRDPAAFPEGAHLWVLQDARMGELYVAALTWAGGEWQTVTAPALWPVQEPARRWADGGPESGVALRLAGNALRACAEALSPVLNRAAGCLLADAEACPSGAALAALATRAWVRGDVGDVAHALPTYVRDKVAQTTAERTAVARGER
ncbi:tRNA (adenosine(37)-N6)-threonylcarbamoyltransferase complex dimerization subunit type 1 TsaB [uncultured Aquabacterium sp.]|uniref:tRNA (adenosine(37)-N6)-threonylcarbamoyltransferase complex dimerization subunit type 1 TsaB n=1 Tax=Aquabacterium sp. TaxID=1872578 RepID=UPI0025D8736A|nr:tRNA (adenosine(37)-N6)-threonylcarbamoyltransferase complex dimerization subunit type 1 TsaB [uncultured Aquabacterium sp.]